MELCAAAGDAVCLAPLFAEDAQRHTATQAGVSCSSRSSHPSQAVVTPEMEQPTASGRLAGRPAPLSIGLTGAGNDPYFAGTSLPMAGWLQPCR